MGKLTWDSLLFQSAAMSPGGSPGAPGQLPAQHLPHPPHVYQEGHAHHRRRRLGGQRHQAGSVSMKADAERTPLLCSRPVKSVSTCQPKKKKLAKMKGQQRLCRWEELEDAAWTRDGFMVICAPDLSTDVCQCHICQLDCSVRWFTRVVCCMLTLMLLCCPVPEGVGGAWTAGGVVPSAETAAPRRSLGFLFVLAVSSVFL